MCITNFYQNLFLTVNNNTCCIEMMRNRNEKKQTLPRVWTVNYL